MAVIQDPSSPRKIGGFIVWLGIAILAALLVFLVIFYYQGHKASIMKNSRMEIPRIYFESQAV